MAEEKNMQEMNQNQNEEQEMKNLTPGGNTVEVVKTSKVGAFIEKVKTAGKKAGKLIWDNRGKIAFIAGTVAYGAAVALSKRGSSEVSCDEEIPVEPETYEIEEAPAEEETIDLSE